MKNKLKTNIICVSFLLSIAFAQSCRVVQPNELGLKQSFGRLNKNTLLPGWHGYVPFFSKIITYDCKILNVSEKTEYATNDGLQVSAEINMLYHINKDSLRNVHIKLGKHFQDKYVATLFRSVVREEVIQYNAKDIMNKIQNLEDSISLTLRPLLLQYGFEIDKVIISDIDLPAEVNQAIKDKVRAEQLLKQRQVEIEIDRQNVVYEAEKGKLQNDSKIAIAKQESEITIIKQKAESQRLIIESRAKKQSQLIIDSSLSSKQLELKKIEATEKLASSPNSKLIITDGKSNLTLKMNEK